MKGNSKKSCAPANEKWVPFARMETIKQPDELIEGYCIPLDKEEFRIFVADEKVPPRRGYFLKLMFEWGKDENINLDAQKEVFHQVTKIFEDFLPDAWINKGTTYRCYKYIMFGHGVANKHLALSLMHSIIVSIANQNGGNK